MKAKRFFTDTALVAAVIMCLVLIGGMVNGEASIWALLPLAAAFVTYNYRKMAKSSQKVKHIKVAAFSDCKHAA